MRGLTKDIWMAYLLWVLFGGIGIHKFYVGKSGMGILYIFLNIMSVLSLSSYLNLISVVPLILFYTFSVTLGVLLIVDAFTMSQQVNECNYRITGTW